MSKIDFKRELKQYYGASAKLITAVQIPAMNFILIDGSGPPESQEYKEAVEALFKVSYTLKFMVKKGDLQIDYSVMPLEGLWWAEDMARFSVDRKEDWLWRMMIMQPDFVTRDMWSEALKIAKQKKDSKAFDRLKFESFNEGLVAQTLYIGPFTEEGPTVERVHNFINENGRQLCGKHHEVYLSDIRKAAPERWRTIIRQPMK